MSDTSFTDISNHISDTCAAFFLVAVSNEGNACVKVQEPGLALSLAAANARLRHPLLPQDILRFQELLGELSKAYATPSKTRPRHSTRTPKPASSQVVIKSEQTTSS